MLSISVSFIQRCSSTESTVVESVFIFVYPMFKCCKFINESVIMDDMSVLYRTRIRNWLRCYVLKNLTDELLKFKYRHLIKLYSQIYDAVLSGFVLKSRLAPSESA